MCDCNRPFFVVVMSNAKRKIVKAEIRKKVLDDRMTVK
jgi:hypothetical protein